MPHLHDDWRRLLRHAWSLRFISLAIFFTFAEVSLPLYQQFINVDPLWLACGAGACSALAFVARLMAQKEFLT